MANWIWLSEQAHPALQHTRYSIQAKEANCPVAVVEFTRTYRFAADSELCFDISADTVYTLYLNGQCLGMGPAMAGGDFDPEAPAPRQYSDRYSLQAPAGEAVFSVLVRLSPQVLCEYSRGHGGLFLSGTAKAAGAEKAFGTDNTWQARLRPDLGPDHDGRMQPGPFEPCAYVEDVWQAIPSGLPVMQEYAVPVQCAALTLAPGEKRVVTERFPHIHAAVPEVTATGECALSLDLFETPDRVLHTLKAHTVEGTYFRTDRLYSVGGYTLTAENVGTVPCTLSVLLYGRHYPITAEGTFACADEGLNRVYRLCKQNLRICRQTLHLDSPKHQEPLACTGDYYIETLMEAFTYGDLRLSALDCRRTADLLVQKEGRMFHTSYSLIYVSMLLDTYRFTGDMALLTDCEPGLRALFARFARYRDSHGLCATPDYMFIDWVMTEGYSMHHPPKYLGQTAINAFYFGALQAGAEIYRLLGKPSTAQELLRTAEDIRHAVMTHLYDRERGLFFDGMPDAEEACPPWLPENAPRRHYGPYGNILAALYALPGEEEGRTLLLRILQSEDLSAVQPYFMHFLLEAVYRYGLFDRYGLPLLRRWVPCCPEGALGIPEGWYKPEPTYTFDQSHAWGGTPAYQLPRAFLGFRMVQPGFGEIALAPQNFGLGDVSVSMPTPYGMIRCDFHDGKPDLSVPEEIPCTVTLEETTQA